MIVLKLHSMKKIKFLIAGIACAGLVAALSLYSIDRADAQDAQQSTYVSPAEIQLLQSTLLKKGIYFFKRNFHVPAFTMSPLTRFFCQKL